MKQFTYTITNPIGIHARPAGLLVKAAKACPSTVTVVRSRPARPSPLPLRAETRRPVSPPWNSSFRTICREAAL